MPHPDDVDVFSFGHTELYNRRTGAWFRANMQDDTGPAHVSPWAAGGNEMVFTWPHGGHDGGLAPVLIDTKFEDAPFSDSLAIHVAAGDCLNLRPGPAPDGEPIECVADGTVVTFIERGTAEGDPATVQSTADATWLNVRTPAGTGWMSAAWIAWGP
jgi:hypothetical protein